MSAQARLRYRFTKTMLDLSYERFETSGAGLFAGSQSDIARLTATRPLTRVWNASFDVGYARNGRIQPLTVDQLTACLNSTTNQNACPANDANTYSYGFAGVSINRHFGHDFHGFLSYQETSFGLTSRSAWLARRAIGFRTGVWSLSDWIGRRGRRGWIDLGVRIMIKNRELTLDDYLAMLRRRAKVILIPALLAPLAGFCRRTLFRRSTRRQSHILVEGQKVPESMVQPVVLRRPGSAMATLQKQVLSQRHLLPVVEKVYPGRSSQQQNEMIDTIRANMAVEPVVTDLSAIGSTTKGGNKRTSPVPGFNLRFTASNAREAQQVCN